jgi:integrase
MSHRPIRLEVTAGNNRPPGSEQAQSLVRDRQRFPVVDLCTRMTRTRAENSTMSVKTAPQLMGHVNVDTTLNVYTQVLDGSVRDAVEKIGGELFTIVH